MADKIELTKAFIEQELPAAPPLYVSIYLMTQVVGRDSAKVAEKLNATESDVLRAWAYWMDRKVMQKEEEKPAKQQPKLIASERPNYTPAEMAVYMQKNESVQKMVQSAQRKLGKLLSHNDMSLLFSFHDWLGLPMDVIELLLSYCVENGHTGMRYIEKVALGWAEEGIHTVDQAVEYIELRKTGFRTILKAFGQNRLPVATEEAYMKKWLLEYQLPMDVITLACERTVLQAGKASFAYADKILTSWRDVGVKTIADVEEQDKAFAAKKTQNTPTEKPAQTAPKKQNRFINYTQREWDFAELERLEQEQREKW